MKRDKHVNWNRVSPETLDLKGIKVVIVGGTGGIGQAVSRFMASRGAYVTVVGRTFKEDDSSPIQFIKADLSRMSEAKRVAREMDVASTDLIIFTTGIFASPKREETSEGIEQDVAVSYLSRLVMIKEMIPRLGKRLALSAPKPRVFIMGYPGGGQTGNADDLNAESSYKALAVHLNTVAGNEMLVLDLAMQYKKFNFYGLNPGLLPTNIRSNLLGANTFKFRAVESLVGLVSMSTKTYAERLTPLLISPDIENHSGAMFDQKGNAILSSPSLTRAHIDKFMYASEVLIERALKNGSDNRSSDS